jgi:hypothetical protein
MKDIPILHFSSYKPGRLEYLSVEPFVKELWEHLTNSERIHSMIKATSENKPAIAYLLAEIEERFGLHLSSKKYPEEDVGVLINNIIKHIMEQMGYEHIACGLFPTARYINSSGLYSILS